MLYALRRATPAGAREYLLPACLAGPESFAWAAAGMPARARKFTCPADAALLGEALQAAAEKAALLDPAGPGPGRPPEVVPLEGTGREYEESPPEDVPCPPSPNASPNAGRRPDPGANGRHSIPSAC